MYFFLSTRLPDVMISKFKRVKLSIYYDRFLGVMPGYSQHDEVLATKLVTFFPMNKEVSTHNAVILVFDINNGIPKTVG